MIALAASAAALTAAPAPIASLPMLGPKWLDAAHIITAFVGWIGPWAILGVMLVIFAETGLLVGFFAIVLMDQIRNTLRRTDDVETKLGRPLLTAIPKLSGASTRKTARMQTLMPDSLYAEAVRTLATSVALAGMEQDMKVVAVSSAMDDEGKTAVACNLAAALATTRRVLLLDADLRRPAVSTIMGLPPGTPGLVQLLTHLTWQRSSGSGE